MTRIPIRSLSSLAALMCLSLGGCMDEAATQHAEAAKAIDTAAVRLDMLSPDIEAAAQEAQSVLQALRAIDVPSGPLASVRSALTAQAQLVLGEASMNAGRATRREVASLGGRIEARLLSLRRLQSFAEHARFTPQQLGAHALEQSMDSRSDRRRTHKAQIDSLQQRIDDLHTQRNADAQHIAHIRQTAQAQRTAALHAGTSAAIPDLEHAGVSLADLAPLESRLELLDIEIESLQDEQRQLQLISHGETSTIDGLESESTELEAFITARNAQIDSMQDRIQTLRHDLVTDATALAAAETGPLRETTADALEHFDAAATESQRAARQAGRNAMADRVLELAARQSALTMAVTRYLSLDRNADLLDRLASQGELNDAAAVREQARQLSNQRDDAMEQARAAAHAAIGIADQLDDGITAESIRARLGSMQDLLDGKPITVHKPVIVTADPTPTQPTTSGEGTAPPAAITAAITFIKASALAELGNADAVADAKAVSDCQTNPGICKMLDVMAQVLPAIASLNTLAGQTFTGPAAMGIQQAQTMLDPAMLEGMVRPMLDMLKVTGATAEGGTATVHFHFEMGPMGSTNVTVLLSLHDGAWLVTGGQDPQGDGPGDTAKIAAAQSLLDQIAALRAKVQSGQINSAVAYLQQFEKLGAALQALSGQ